MEIRNIRHKGLRALVTKGNPRGLPQNYVVKITDILAYLIDMGNIDEVFALQKYKPHLLSGDRTGVYSLNVTANWRITFKHDATNNELYDVNFEDYH